MFISCTALFVSISQVIGCEDRLRNDLLCVGWGVKLYSLTHLYLYSYLNPKYLYSYLYLGLEYLLTGHFVFFRLQVML